MPVTRFTLFALVASSLIGCAQTGVVGELGDAGSASADASETLIQRCRDLAFGLGGVCIGFDEFPVFAMRCLAVNSDVVQQFNTCASAGGCPDSACLGLLVSGAQPLQVTDCQNSCDTLLSFDCITAAEQVECATIFETATSTASATFVECASHLCNQAGCLAALRGR